MGDLRFKPPQPVTAADYGSVPIDASDYGPVCLQPAQPVPTGSEDCLNLNIWAHADNRVRPVFVFLHGGVENGAGGSMAAIDGASLAQSSDMVVITLNRRLGAFGNLAIEELVLESDEQTAGNYGLRDVLEALRWINAHIPAFNGDPERVMIAGVSAGAFSLCHLVAAPEANGLFHAAALQSPGCSRRMVLDDTIDETTTLPPAVQAHRALITETGCESSPDILQCLRDASAEALLAAAQAVSTGRGPDNVVFSPLIDGKVVVSNPFDALENEVSGPIPMIFGSTGRDGDNLLPPLEPEDDASYRNSLDIIFGPLADDVYQQYPTADYPSALDAFDTLMTDLIYACQAEFLARAAAGGSAPAYLYTLEHGFSNGFRAGEGAVHGIDVPHLFNTFEVFDNEPDATSQAIRQVMQHTWSLLAADPVAAPIIDGAGSWPTVDENALQLLQLGEPVEIVDEHRGGRCPALVGLFTP